MVWNIDRHGTWEKRIPTRDGAPFRERPAILRIEFLPAGRFTFAGEQPDFVLEK